MLQENQVLASIMLLNDQSSIQQLLNEAEQDMKNSAVPPRPITPSFIQNNSKFKNKLKRALIPLSMLSSCISILHLYREGQDIKGLFKSANILQIAVAVRRVVFFLLFLPCFQTIFCRETSKMFRPLFGHFVLTSKTTQPRPQVLRFTVQYPNVQLGCSFDVITSI